MEHGLPVVLGGSRGYIESPPCHLGLSPMPWTLNIELDREEDGRWIADIPALPGTQCYGGTRAEAMVQALALRVLAERLDHNEAPSDALTISFLAA